MSTKNSQMSSCQKSTFVPKYIRSLLEQAELDNMPQRYSLYWCKIGKYWTVRNIATKKVLNPYAKFSWLELKAMRDDFRGSYNLWKECKCCCRHKENPFSREQTQFLSKIGFVTSHNSLTTPLPDPLKNVWRCDCLCRHNMRWKLSELTNKQPGTTWVPQRPECPKCPE